MSRREVIEKGNKWPSKNTCAQGLGTTEITHVGKNAIRAQYVSNKRRKKRLHILQATALM